MNDIRPGATDGFLDSAVWEVIFSTAQRCLEAAGYRRVWLPVVEETRLFARGIGEGTDVVSKEMFSFEDRAGRALSLRPEGTAGCARAYVEHNLGQQDPGQRWWYGGPMYRAERPQRGRYRQFYQIGAELFGSAEPAADAELLALLWKWCVELGLEDIEIRINTLGDADSRAAYRETLVAFLNEQRDALCAVCQERIEANPLRVLDCKRETCRQVAQGAPDVADSLTPAASHHFENVETLLQAQDVPYRRDPRLVRGLDYYTGTLFEFTTKALGAQDAILGGGRYDGLVETLGGPSTPATGFAAGVERIALLMADQPRFSGRLSGPHLYIAPMDGDHAQAFALAQQVRDQGSWRVEVDVGGGRLKQQMKRADRSGARFSLVLGGNEIAQGAGKLKDLGLSSEVEVKLTGTDLASALSAASSREES